jgi:hypothetical protein
MDKLIIGFIGNISANGKCINFAKNYNGSMMTLSSMYIWKQLTTKFEIFLSDLKFFQFHLFLADSKCNFYIINSRL